jgi:hypothetical protein
MLRVTNAMRATRSMAESPSTPRNSPVESKLGRASKLGRVTNRFARPQLHSDHGSGASTADEPSPVETNGYARPGPISNERTSANLERARRLKGGKVKFGVGEAAAASKLQAQWRGRMQRMSVKKEGGLAAFVATERAAYKLHQNFIAHVDLHRAEELAHNVKNMVDSKTVSNLQAALEAHHLAQLKEDVEHGDPRKVWATLKEISRDVAIRFVETMLGAVGLNMMLWYGCVSYWQGSNQDMAFSAKKYLWLFVEDVFGTCAASGYRFEWGYSCWQFDLNGALGYKLG